MSFRIHRRDTELRFVAKYGEIRPLRSCLMDYHTKKLVPAPILPKIGRLRLTYPERCHLLTCPHTEFGPDRLRFAGLIPKRLIFLAQKVNTI